MRETGPRQLGAFSPGSGASGKLRLFSGFLPTLFT